MIKGSWRSGALAVVASLLLVVAIAGCGTPSGTTSGTGGKSGATSTPTSASSTGGTTSCTTGTSTVNGVQVEQVCGPAKAQATLGGQAASWSGGKCTALSSIFTMTIGAIAMDAQPNDLKKFNYISVTVTGVKGDGTYTQAIVSGNYNGQSFAEASGSVTLSNGQTAGTFTGQDITSQATISGSFTCN